MPTWIFLVISEIGIDCEIRVLCKLCMVLSRIWS
ncbi:hypothetical protein SLEP1_g36862 [Rubroshorea leprosula]|uniref:Uncharacterized protein n=1 Tax=Rubroshorea leprosula TaxID=152421 RepID=A0AAV5KSV0_9ROSI|nr:hypothetical protein SLEP1_g36862 [Rubroshorea leprosula]